MTGNSDQKKLKILETEFRSINQQLSVETEITRELFQKEQNRERLKSKQQNLLSIAPRSFVELAQTQKKLDKAIEEKDKVGFFKKRKTQLDEISSLQEAVRLSKIKAIAARDDVDVIQSRKYDLENEIDALTYQLNNAQAIDRAALQKRQQEVQKEMNLFAEKELSIRLRKSRKDSLLQIRSVQIRGKDDNERE